MTLPGFEAIPLSGFAHTWLLMFAVVPIALLTLYVSVQIRRRQRLNRFSDPALVNSVSPPCIPRTAPPRVRASSPRCRPSPRWVR